MKAYTPTQASGMTGSSVAGGMGGGTPLADAAFKPLPIPGHPPQKNVRANNAPVNHFQATQALPHMIHPQNNVGMPMSKGVMKAPKIGGTL
jgi:hypothetical protein